MLQKYKTRYKRLGLLKEWQRKSRYGMRVGAFASMVQKQMGKCAACLRPFGKQVKAVDHDHKTGVIRGIIHRQCNSMIGLAKESASILENAAKYLRKGEIHGN